jgi:hypothetical protein
MVPVPRNNCAVADILAHYFAIILAYHPIRHAKA